MVKYTSYYDWELSLKKKPESKIESKRTNVDKENIHKPLGIKENIWKEYLNSWKKKNLP